VNSKAVTEPLRPEANIPANVISQEVVRHKEQQLAAASARSLRAQPKPKPQLLMAVGLGFLLGRAFDLVGGRAHGANRNGKTGSGYPG
jgi:hypothetical protein